MRSNFTLFSCCLQAAWPAFRFRFRADGSGFTNPAGYNSASLGAGGSVFAVGPDGKLAIGQDNGSDGATVTVYDSIGANRHALATFSAPAGEKFDYFGGIALKMQTRWPLAKILERRPPLCLADDRNRDAVSAEPQPEQRSANRVQTGRHKRHAVRRACQRAKFHNGTATKRRLHRRERRGDCLCHRARRRLSRRAGVPPCRTARCSSATPMTRIFSAKRRLDRFCKSARTAKSRRRFRWRAAAGGTLAASLSTRAGNLFRHNGSVRSLNCRTGANQAINFGDVRGRRERLFRRSFSFSAAISAPTEAATGTLLVNRRLSVRAFPACSPSRPPPCRNPQRLIRIFGYWVLGIGRWPATAEGETRLKSIRQSFFLPRSFC